MVGTDKRIALVAEDLVKHWEARYAAMEGTAMREGQKRGNDLGLTDDEVAFYDALEVNDSAVKVLGEPTLKDIARELVSHVRKSVTIDWTLRESAQAQIRVLVRRILRKYGYPPTNKSRPLRPFWLKPNCSAGNGLIRRVNKQPPRRRRNQPLAPARHICESCPAQDCLQAIKVPAGVAKWQTHRT